MIFDTPELNEQTSSHNLLLFTVTVFIFVIFFQII